VQSAIGNGMAVYIDGQYGCDGGVGGVGDGGMGGTIDV